MIGERTLIRGGTVVDAIATRVADVLVEGERIVEVAPGIDPTGARVVDASDQLVMPGFVDAHTHLSMPQGGLFTADDWLPGPPLRSRAGQRR